VAKHRTPEELLAQALARVNDLKLKVAQSQISNDPRMMSLLTEEKEVKKELTKAMKWLDPEKGLNARIVKLEIQIKEAEANLANAENIQEELKAKLDANHDKQTELSKELDISTILSNLEMGSVE